MTGLTYPINKEKLRDPKADSGVVTTSQIENPLTDCFHEIVVAKTGNPHISREAGRFSVSCKRIGAAKQYALGFVNPASIYLRIGKVAKTISRGAIVRGKKLDGTKVEIISTPTPETNEKPYQFDPFFTTKGTGKGTEFILKPIMMNELAEIVRSVLDGG